MIAAIILRRGLGSPNKATCLLLSVASLVATNTSVCAYTTVPTRYVAGSRSSSRSFSPAVATMSSHAADCYDIDGLASHGFTNGLCEALIRDSQMTSRRFWIMDNSGSMSTPDGQRFVFSSTGNKNDVQLSPCTRWKELQETAIYHAQLAGFLHLETEFQFLNSPGPFQKSFVVKNSNDAVKAQQTILRSEPMGATPLTTCVQDVQKKVERMLPKLTRDGTRVSLVIATDGLPTDTLGYGGEQPNTQLGRALESISRLPVSLVIRLCTNDAHVVEFYNSLDARLELNLDVLDDFEREAKEVQATNKWLTYGLPLHRFREGGFRSRLADLLDERKLTKDELRDFCGFVFGESVMMDGLPDPQTDWGGFRKEVSRLQAKEALVYNPISMKMASWIHLPPLGSLF